MISISKNIQLQKIKIEDQPKLMSLLSLIYPPAYKHLWVNENCNFYLNKFYSLANLKIELSEPDSRYYFVIYNSILVGIFRIIFNKQLDDFPEQKATYVNRIYLAEEAQGKDVANQLFNWTESKAKENNNNLIWLKAMDTQKQALRFYEKQGYSYGNPTKLNFELIHPQLRGMAIMHKQLT